MNKKLLSWGRYPAHSQTAHPCHWRGDILQGINEINAQHGTGLPFGNGRSYGDSCLAVTDQVLHLRTLNRFIDINWETGLIRAEAGVTLDELLKLVMPKGWFLPVTPGTQFVTLGGALANDVHGKNHHIRGTFGRHVPRFGLIRSDRPALTCSLSENSELYAATIGGLGLTGIIEWLELQLMPIQSSLIESTYVRFETLDEFFTLCAELDTQFEYSVAWIDCLARGKSVGRGIYMSGNHAEEGPLTFARPAKLNIPLSLPFSAINGFSLSIFNSLYYRAHPEGRHNNRVHYESFFYPLDRIQNWNRIYGPRGFQQYQCVIPDCNAVFAFKEMLDAIAAVKSGSFLAVLKRFGEITSPGLLSFPQPGTTLALDFPQQSETTGRLFARLDAIVREAKGRLYPAKDAHMSGEDFKASYRNWEKFETFRDPLFLSKFWARMLQIN